MKKFWTVFLLLITVCSVSITTIHAEEYQNYQEIVFDSDEGKLLKEYSDKEITSYKDKLKKRKFMGWKIDVINEEETVEFISETKLKIYNNGFSTIKHDITLNTKEETKIREWFIWC